MVSSAPRSSFLYFIILNIIIPKVLIILYLYIFISSKAIGVCSMVVFSVPRLSFSYSYFQTISKLSKFLIFLYFLKILTILHFHNLYFLVPISLSTTASLFSKNKFDFFIYRVIHRFSKEVSLCNFVMQGRESESDVGSGGKHSALYLPPTSCAQTIGQDSSNNSSQLNQKILSFQTNFLHEFSTQDISIVDMSMLISLCAVVLL